MKNNRSDDSFFMFSVVFHVFIGRLSRKDQYYSGAVASIILYLFRRAMFIIFTTSFTGTD